jgi:hypothetical protein
MRSRLDELLARKKRSAAEQEELASLLNAPVLGPFEGVPRAFASKHQFAPTDVAARVAAIDWFAHAGRPASLDLTMETEQVKGWSAAVRACKSRVWENAELEAQNQLTLWLHQHARERYRGWNKLVGEYKKAVLKPLTQRGIRPVLRRHGLPDDVLHSVEWNVLGALMENAYLDTGHGLYFALELLLVYEAGHFPCGWRGDWPQGRLIVY